MELFGVNYGTAAKQKKIVTDDTSTKFGTCVGEYVTQCLTACSVI